MGRISCDDEFWLVFESHCTEIVIVHEIIMLSTGLVSHKVKNFAHKSHGATMREVASVTQIHSENRITWLEESIKDTDIGSRTRESLDIRMISTEEFLRSLYRDCLHLVGEFLATVIAFSWESFCVFIAKYTSECFLYCWRSIVFRRDELHAVIFSEKFSFYGSENSWVSDVEGEVFEHKKSITN